ncbi:hypothetical protein [Leucobacter salsicius]|uniref:hypothetical protein n=1 Tax=Leucobacter salsicius TaxID=664638 RepID=UPI0012FB5FE1|nr:hypothetical protein [Leucobacter salsicius]
MTDEIAGLSLTQTPEGITPGELESLRSKYMHHGLTNFAAMARDVARSHGPLASYKVANQGIYSFVKLCRAGSPAGFDVSSLFAQKYGMIAAALGDVAGLRQMSIAARLYDDSIGLSNGESHKKVHGYSLAMQEMKSILAALKSSVDPEADEFVRQLRGQGIVRAKLNIQWLIKCSRVIQLNGTLSIPTRDQLHSERSVSTQSKSKRFQKSKMQQTELYYSADVVEHIWHLEHRGYSPRIFNSTAMLWLGSSNRVSSLGDELHDEVDRAFLTLVEKFHDDTGMSVLGGLWKTLLHDGIPEEGSQACLRLFGVDRLPGCIKTAAPDASAYVDRRISLTTYKGTGHTSNQLKAKLPKFNSLDFLTVLSARLRCIYIEAENSVRGRHGLPLRGEGWVGELELFKMLETRFERNKVVFQGRPAWLGRQSFDIYFPNERVAVEYQGAQHSRPVALFGGEQGFLRTQERDARKRALSEQHGCVLIEVFPGYDPEAVAAKVSAALSRADR